MLSDNNCKARRDASFYGLRARTVTRTLRSAHKKKSILQIDKPSAGARGVVRGIRANTPNNWPVPAPGTSGI
jgi:hypothetical protein